MQYFDNIFSTLGEIEREQVMRRVTPGMRPHYNVSMRRPRTHVYARLQHCTNETQCMHQGHSPKSHCQQDDAKCCKALVLHFTSRFSQQPLPVISITVGDVKPLNESQKSLCNHGLTSTCITEGPCHHPICRSSMTVIQRCFKFRK